MSQKIWKWTDDHPNIFGGLFCTGLVLLGCLIFFSLGYFLHAENTWVGYICSIMIGGFIFKNLFYESSNDKRQNNSEVSS